MQPKEFPGLDESTYLTRSFADQGAKVRIRKEPNRKYYLHPSALS